MIELHERLSEFSYGYGVTRDIQELLKSVGIKTVPFFPSLLDEAKVGFDVGFKKPGRPLMLQFKLGQLLKRFRKKHASDTIPTMARPFWRFAIDTSEEEGQYETLLKAELDGAEVYYAAPRFVEWSDYATLFEASEVLEHSALIRPTAIRRSLEQKGISDGRHRVVYDASVTYVCSEPSLLPEVSPRELVAKFQGRLSAPLGDVIADVFHGLDSRHLVRRKSEPQVGVDHEEQEILRSVRLRTPKDASGDRHRWLESFRGRAETEEEAMAAALGLEAWRQGIQLVLAAEQ